jgi:DNA-binding NtrC family response regulator
MRPAATSGQATVLLVDDFAGIRELFAELLREAGYRVLEASNAGLAQQLAGEEAKIDILITDFRMPGMNGVELARWFRSRFPLSQVLLVSGAGCELDAYLELPGWPAFLDKTEAVIKLVATVEKLLAQTATRSEGFGAAEIAQRASANTMVLREILERGNQSRAWIRVVHE